MKNDKRGFATVMSLIGGVIGLVFLVIFAFVFITQLTGTNLLTTGSAQETATNNMVGNFTEGVEAVSVQIPTVLSIGAFILIITVLLLAWVLARRNGLIGGGGNLG